MGLEIRRIVAIWLQRNHWRREAKAWRQRVTELEQALNVARDDWQYERSYLQDRLLQACKLSAIPRPVRAAEMVPVTPEPPERNEYEEAIFQEYRNQVKEAGLPLVEADRMFDAFRKGEFYELSNG